MKKLIKILPNIYEMRYKGRLQHYMASYKKKKKYFSVDEGVSAAKKWYDIQRIKDGKEPKYLKPQN